MSDKTQGDQIFFANNEHAEVNNVNAIEQEGCDFGNNANVESCKKMTSKKMKFSTKKAIKHAAMKVVSATLFCISAVLLLMCVSNLYQNVFNPDGYTGFLGIGEAVVASNSMNHPESSPRIQANDLVFYEKANADEISVGDIIIYKKEAANGDDTLIVHRVVQIDNDSFVAKGDNNEIEDEAMPTSAIIGKYMFKIDKIGAILKRISSVGASIAIIAILLFVFALRILIYLLYKKSVIRKISLNESTRRAIDYFFDI